jgi:uncharacterized protein (DUF697 family)
MVIPFAAAVAASAIQPLPLADTPVMIGIQSLMMVSLTACFGNNALSKTNFVVFLGGLGGTFGAAVVGRTFLSLIKFIPEFGKMIGAELNSATGATITLALGNTYISVLASMIRRGAEINEKTVKDELR